MKSCRLLGNRCTNIICLHRPAASNFRDQIQDNSGYEMKQNGAQSEDPEALHQTQVGIPDGTVQRIVVQIAVDLVRHQLKAEGFVCAGGQVEDLQIGRASSVLRLQRVDIIASGYDAIDHHIDGYVVHNDAGIQGKATQYALRCAHEEALRTVLRNGPSGNGFLPSGGDFSTLQRIISFWKKINILPNTHSYSDEQCRRGTCWPHWPPRAPPDAL